MQQPGGEALNGGRRFQMGRPGTTGSASGSGPGITFQGCHHTLKDELVTEGDQFCTTSLAAGPELW